MADWMSLVQFACSTGAVAYVALDRWVHRGEQRTPASLQLQIEQNAKDTTAALGAARREQERDLAFAETLRVERAKQVDARFEALDEKVRVLGEKASRYGTEQQRAVSAVSERLAKEETRGEETCERLERIEKMFDGIRATVDRRVAQQPHSHGERRRE